MLSTWVVWGNMLATPASCSVKHWVVEADIKGFFDHVSHAHLERFLAHSITDGNLLRIIRRFLKAGILEDGAFMASEEGTPQGGLVSPVLSNIYLHYVLDLWFEKRYARSCEGRAHLIRYADDYVACFQKKADARRFLTEMTERLAQFDLEVEPSKTALLQFGRRAMGRKARDGLGPRIFSFLGFTHYVVRSRTGRFVVGRKIDAKRLRKKLKLFGERLRGLRSEGGRAMLEYAQRHLRGHIQYYGASGNSRGGGLRVFRHGFVVQVAELTFITKSSNHPILYHQTRHPFKFALVVGDHNPTF